MRFLPGAVTVVAEDLERVPAPSLGVALQGKVPGAMILRSSGAPGGPTIINFRGIHTVFGRFAPFYVLDGIQIHGDPMPSSLSISPGPLDYTGLDHIADIPVSEIERVEVLRGPASAALYGVMGSQGVIVITTKRGKAGHRSFGLRQRIGFSSTERRLGARPFASLADATAAWGTLVATDPTNGWAPGRLFDNESELVGQTPISYQTAFDASGGSLATRYRASLQAERAGGTVTNTFQEKRSAGFNLDRQTPRVQGAFGVRFVEATGERGVFGQSADPYGILLLTPSFADLRQNADDSWPSPGYAGRNLLQDADAFEDRERTRRTLINGQARFDLAQGDSERLTLEAFAGLDRLKQTNEGVFPSPLPQGSPSTTEITGDHSVFNHNLDLGLVFRYGLGRGGGGQSSVRGFVEGRSLTSNRRARSYLILNPDAVGSASASQETRSTTWGMILQQHLATAADRMALDLGARGELRHSGSGSRFAWFPMGSLAVNVPSPAGSRITVRIAAGATEDDPGGLNRAFIFVPVGTTVVDTVRAERHAEIEAGIGASLWRERLEVRAAGFRRTVPHLYIEQAAAPSPGTPVLAFDAGRLRTQGFELDARIVPVRAGSLEWVISGTLSRARGRITEMTLPSFQRDGITFQVDSSVTQIVGLDTLADGSSVTRTLGDAHPDFTFSIGSRLQYGGIEWWALLDGSHGASVVNTYQRRGDQLQLTPDYAEPGAGGQPIGEVRRATSLRTGRVYLQDASFTRLREVAISFTVRSWRVWLAGRDLLTFSPYQGIDPEHRRASPVSGMAGVGNGVQTYPPSRSLWVGADLKF